MGKQRQKTSKKKTADPVLCGNDELMSVNPAFVRFQHSRIRPYFSSCGRAVTETLDDIRSGKITADDLPPIQVIVGPSTQEGQWYFSLNNRRLWVLKRCNEEGLLVNNRILVRVRPPKSKAEEERYTLGNCAVEAKFMKEKVAKKETQMDVETEGAVDAIISATSNISLSQPRKEIDFDFDDAGSSHSDSDETDEDFNVAIPQTNRFLGLL